LVADRRNLDVPRSATKAVLTERILTALRRLRNEKAAARDYRRTHTVRAAEELPWDVYTADEWGRLGYRPTGYGKWWCGGRQYTGCGDRIPDNGGRANEAIDAIAGGFGPLELLYQLNKHAKFETVKHYYALKDCVMRLSAGQCVRGEITRVEESECFGCDGSGGRAYDECRRCGGTGIYSSRTLYLWVLREGEREYQFHSYVKPPRVDATHDDGGTNFGRRITDFDRWLLTPVEIRRALNRWCQTEHRRRVVASAQDDGAVLGWYSTEDRLNRLLTDEERRRFEEERMGRLRAMARDQIGRARRFYIEELSSLPPGGVPLWPN
jgi:hypothetical protein